MVLMKDVDERGFTFATSYASRKGRELAENSRAALLFYWHALGRQVRVEGTVERVSPEESDEIFLARPRDSRISALASRQSEPVASREELEARVRELTAQLDGDGGRAAGVLGRLPRWRRTRSSSGSTARTGCTSASRTAARRDGWTIDELQP